MNMTESKPFTIACIPAFNEERTIGSVVVRAMKYVDRVVVCDDGSGDLTGAIAGGLGAVVVRHERNSGCLMATILRQNVYMAKKQYGSLGWVWC